MTNALRGFASLLGLTLSITALTLLSSCGGGGASVNPDLGGPVQIFPTEGTFFAGVPAIITVSGSHFPYSLTSSEPGVLPVPAITNDNKVVVVPNNPGTVDPGLLPGQLPIRTVVVSVRGPNATSAQATIHVAQNFLTSYTASIVSSGCPVPAGSATTTVAACSGQAGVITMLAVFNGALHGGQKFRFCTVIGDFQFFDINTNSFVSSSCSDPKGGVEVTSDHEGKVIVPFRVFNGAPSQLAIFRIQDFARDSSGNFTVGTGAFTDTIFTINGPGSVPQSTLTAIPQAVSFTGRNGQECGTGSADVFVFDGKPPFTVFNSDTAHITVTPTSTGANPPRFTITVTNPNPPCLTAVPVVITDSTGAHTTVTVTTQLGTSPPTSPLTVAPNAITLACGQTGSVSVAGGSGNYFANSTDQQVQAIAFGNTVSITRLRGDTFTHVTPATVSVTDGATIATVTVNIPTSCP